MTANQYGTAPVLDIITFGYKKLFNHLWPMTQLSLPFVLFSSIVMGVVYPDYMAMTQEASTADDVSMEMAMNMVMVAVIMLVATFAMLYYIYVMYYYIRDVYRDQVQESLYNYFLPTRMLWGLIGINLMYMIAWIPAIILLIIGFILLILPGFVVLAGIVFMSVRVLMVCNVYMMNPDAGVFGAFTKSWELTRENVLRTFGLLFTVLIIQSIISTPTSIIITIAQMAFQFVDVLSGTLIQQIGYSLIYFLGHWAQYVLGVGGMLFVTYRYYYDLEAQLQPVEVTDPASLPTDYWNQQ